MKKKLKVLGIIPARGGSKAIPGKNIKKLHGKPLIFYTINEAKKSKFLDFVVVSTEDKKIEKVTQKYGVVVVKRPKKLSADSSTSISVLKHAIINLKKTKKFIPDIIVVLQPTSPLRNAADIDGAIKKFLHLKCDSVISMTKVSSLPYWIYKLRGNIAKNIIKKPKKVYRRQDSQKFYQVNGAVYVTSKNMIINHNTIFGKKISAYIMPQERSVDLDTMIDFKLAEILMKKS